MPERRVTCKHPDYERLSGLANDLSVITNPQLFWQGPEFVDEQTGVLIQSPNMDIDGPERQAIIEIIQGQMEVELEGGRFADWINQNPKFDVSPDETEGTALQHED
jgi:hypothetical protein